MVVVFPVTKTALGAMFAQLVSIWDLPKPGSPTINTWRAKKGHAKYCTYITSTITFTVRILAFLREDRLAPECGSFHPDF